MKKQLKELQIKPLEWDSDFMQLRVGSCSLDDATEWNTKELEKWDLVYISVLPEEKLSSQILSREGIKIMDEKITYLLKLDQVVNQPTQAGEIRSYHHSERDEVVISIGVQSNIYSRFSMDPRFGRANADKMYAIWMQRSINRILAKEVFIAEDQSGSISGVITLTEKDGRADIGILAVDQRIRGQKTGTKLINSAISYSIKRGYKELQVVTQSANQAACKFYENCGFKKEKLVNIYHYWNKQ